MKTNRNAFTMIELLFVIVVLGIVGGITLEAIRQYYNGIYRTQVYTQRVSEADQMLELISKYFENAIADSIIVRDKDNVAGCVGPPPVNDDGSDYTIAFYSVDRDGLQGYVQNNVWTPGWNPNGLSVGGNYSSPESNFTAMNAAPFQALANSAAIYRHENSGLNICTRHNWDVHTAENDSVYRVITGVSSDSNVTLNGALNTTGAVSRAYLMRTAYAFRAKEDKFWMYSNYQPWNGDTLDNATQSLLGKHVTHFMILHNEQNTTVNSNIGMIYTLKLCMKGLDGDLVDSTAREDQICRERMVRVRY